MAPEGPFHVVINPASGAGDAARRRQVIEDALRGVGRPAEFAHLEAPSECASAMARAARLFVANNRLQLGRLGLDESIVEPVGRGRLAAVFPKPITFAVCDRPLQLLVPRAQDRMAVQ